jgi:hypothetical protein
LSTSPALLRAVIDGESRFVFLEGPAMPLNETASKFMTFDYAEAKDLCKQFLGLVSGILVLSVTFSEKIVDFPRARLWPRIFLFSCWVLLICAIIAGGIALMYLAMAGGQAVYGGSGRYPTDAWTAYRLIIGAGTCFVAALVCLATAGATSLFRTRKDRTAAPTAGN